MRVGSGSPTFMSFVLSLKSLQNCPMLIFLYNTDKRSKVLKMTQICSFSNKKT